MQVCLPFVYSIVYRKPGKDAPAVKHAVSHVDADMPELSASDVSTAARWRMKMRNGTSRGEEACLAWNGALYRPIGPNRDAVDLTQLPSRAFDDRGGFGRLERLYALHHSRSSDYKLLNASLLGQSAAGKRPKEPSIISTDMEAARNEAQAMVDGLIAVDNVVHMKTQPFMYSVQFLGGAGLSMSVVPPLHGYARKDLLSGTWGIQSRSREMFFGLTEHSLLESCVGAKAPGHPLMWEVDVEEPDLLAVEGRREFAARLMNYCVRTTDHDVGDMPHERMLQWMAMRDAVMTHYALEPTPVNDDAIRTLDEYSRELPPSFSRDEVLHGLELLDCIGGLSPSSSTSFRP